MSYTVGSTRVINATSASGTTDFTFTFPYIKEAHIEVYKDYTKLAQATGSVIGANEYKVITNVSPKLIRLGTATASANVRIEIRRNSSLDEPLVDYADGSTLTANDLDTSALQSLYIDQELKDSQFQTVSIDEATGLPSLGESGAGNLRLTKVADPTAAQDAATKNYVDTTAEPKNAKLTELATMAQNTANALADLTEAEVQAIDGLTASTDELNILDGVTATKDEINILDGVTATKDELNILDGVTATKDEINILDGVTATKDELNILDGVTATKDELNILDGVTATKDEINILDGVTATKDELNILDGVTATKDEINILDGVTATKDEINKLDGVTASTTEINKLDGLTATTTELNKLDGVTATTDELNKTDGLLATPTELNTLDGITSNTSELNKLDGVTASTAELNIVAGKTFKTSSGTLDTTSDTEIPSSKVIAAHVASSQTAIGGFVTIADEVSFPTTANMPANGVVVSINNAAGVVVNGSGVSTTGRTTDGTPATVTINGFPSSLNGETLAAGVGLMVTATSTSNTYSYHKILAAETDVKQLSDDINDFNARYRVASSAPGSNNDEGDLYFDTAANKMKVYNGSAWDDVASVGSFFVNTLSSSSGTGGGSATFNGSAYRFTLSNAGTSAQQHIVSVNGVIQKPNSGTSQPSEGFALDGNDIIFSAAPASGSDFFIVTSGSSVSIGTPSANSVNSSHIIDGSIVNGDISSSANISGSKLADASVTNTQMALGSVGQGHLQGEAVNESKIQISNTGTNGQFLQKQSGNNGGLTWADVASYTHPNHSGEVTSSADGAQTIADDVVDEANLKISNAGTNGQFLQKQSGNTGGLTWADAGGGVDSDAQGNTLVGKYAGQYITTGDANTIIGYQGTGGISTGSKNTLIGSGVGASGSNTTRVYEGNTFIGHNMAQECTSGSYNIAIGKGAANDLTTGNDNIYMGNSAGSSAAGASKQIGIGEDALKNCTSTTQNIAIGYKAGEKNTTNADNVFIGNTAGKGATSGCTGAKNVAIGTTALQSFTSAYNCTAIGHAALASLTTGFGNHAIGFNAGTNITTGTENNAFGQYALSSCTDGSENHALGYWALLNVTSGGKNVGVAGRAGQDITTGDNNICIGHYSGTSSSPSGSISTGDNNICLGNNNIANLYCADTSISSSDKRDKTDIADFTHGLSWVNKLKPVTYRWDKRVWYNEYNEDGSLKTEVTPDGSKKRARQHIGFLAQDVLAIEQADGYASKKDDMLVVNLNEDDTAYGLKYERLVPVLVNAIKELSAKVETLETKVAALEAK